MEGMGLIIRKDSGYVHMRAEMRSFETDSLSRVIAGGGTYGVGKVIYTTVNTTYVRKLAGQSAVYAAYWSSLLRRVGRLAEARDEWTLMPTQPRVGEETDAVLEDDGAGQPLGLVGASGSAGLTADAGGSPVSLYFAQDDLLPFIWRGRYWPEGVGWQNLWKFGGDTVTSYVWPRGAWASFYRELRRRETLDYRGRSPESETAGEGAKVEVPKYWFYVIFLISVVFLWVERRIGGMSGNIIQ